MISGGSSSFYEISKIPTVDFYVWGPKKTSENGFSYGRLLATTMGSKDLNFHSWLDTNWKQQKLWYSLQQYHRWQNLRFQVKLLRFSYIVLRAYWHTWLRWAEYWACQKLIRSRSLNTDVRYSRRFILSAWWLLEASKSGLQFLMLRA